MLRAMTATGPRTYSFRITVTVEPGDPAYDDPEWFADASAGVLSNVYGYECLYDEVAEVDALQL